MIQVIDLIFYLYRWIFTELVSAGEASGSGTDDDDVGIGVGDHVRHVPTGHFARHDRLLDGIELERLQIVRRRRGGHGNGEVVAWGGFDGLEAARCEDG